MLGGKDTCVNNLQESLHDSDQAGVEPATGSLIKWTWTNLYFEITNN